MNPFAIDFGEPILAVQCGATADDDPVDFRVAMKQAHDYYPDVKRGVTMRFGDRATNPAGAIWAVALRAANGGEA
jgi:hypothetical protein